MPISIPPSGFVRQTSRALIDEFNGNIHAHTICQLQGEDRGKTASTPKAQVFRHQSKKKTKNPKNIMVQRNEAVYLKRSYGLKCYICIIVFFNAFVFCLCFLFLSVLRIKSLLRANSAQTFPQLRKKTRAGVLI